MKLQHLSAFLWLRWRLKVNQFRRAGVLNVVILVILSVAIVLLALGLFVGSLLIGLFALPHAAPVAFLYTWDGLVVAYLFFGAIALVADLQRSEVLSLDKLLHLPVSLSGAFLINYISSLFSLNVILFLPPMLGLCLAQVIVKGPVMLLALPLVAGFVLMVTAITYQFQGWLAALMVNKRRRRTIIVLVTAGFVVLCQLPNLLNYFQPWNVKKTEQINQQLEVEEDLRQALAKREITVEEFQRKIDEGREKQQDEKHQAKQETLDQIERATRLVNLVLPPGWLPLGTMGLTEGHVPNALLGIMGLALLGSASLWRAYRTTQRLYTGQYTSGRKKEVATEVRTSLYKARSLFLEKKLPWISDQAAVISLGGFRSLWRAPEAKMMLLSPVILLLVFGAMFLRQPMTIAEPAKLLIAFGAISMILLTMVQMVGNQFGFDRNGFRVYVLCPAPRKDILLGKNLAFAPWALGLGSLAALFVQVVYRMRLDHFLAIFPLMISMFLLYSLLANCLSILSPMPIASGSLKPTNTKLVPVLLQLAFVLIMPMVLGPTLLPLGIEQLLVWLGWIQSIPVCLALSVVECAGVLWVYNRLVKLQGDWLQSREKAILQIVSTRAE